MGSITETPSTGDPELDQLVAEAGIVHFLHHGDRLAIVTFSIENWSLEDAHRNGFGIRRWRHLTVSIKGALRERLADQRRIGRKREGGERSPAPLPDWYELTHLAYDHSEFGFDRTQPIWQFLPPPAEDYLNMAEALHLRQPA